MFPLKGGTPKSSIFIGFPLFSPSILGYPSFWKHPNNNGINCTPKGGQSVDFRQLSPLSPPCWACCSMASGGHLSLREITCVNLLTALASKVAFDLGYLLQYFLLLHGQTDQLTDIWVLDLQAFQVGCKGEWTKMAMEFLCFLKKTWVFQHHH